MASPNDRLTTAQAAAIAKVTQGTVSKWCMDLDLPAAKHGHAYMIRRGDLMTFLATPRKRPGQYDRAAARERG